jgi:hypothetical protein
MVYVWPLLPDLREIFVKRSMKMPSSSSLVELSPHYFKIKGSCPTTGARSEGEIVKTSIKMPNSGGRLVEHLPRHSKIKGLCPATASRSEGDNGIDINERT